MDRAFRKIVLASHQEDVASLVELLRQQGLEVELCRDGARALERSLALSPELMLLDTAIPLLPAPRLTQILLANPRTERMAFFYLGHEGEEVDGFRRHKDSFLPRPFNAEQLLSAILAHFNRRERSEQVGKQEKEIRGTLNQIALTDLIQVLGGNRKDGLLALSGSAGRGVLYLRDGCVINARYGRVEGDKAFFRLLAWTDGDFLFTPGPVEVPVRITQSIDHLVIDGLRQFDEMRAQAALLPQPEDCLELKVPANLLPRGLRPATQEILLLAETYPQVADLLDHCLRPDFEVLQVLRVLIDKGLLEKRKAGFLPDVGRAALLTSDEIIGIRDHLGERDDLLVDASAKLVLLTTRAEEVRRLVQTLQGLPEFEPAQDALSHDDRPGLGDVGRLIITDTFSLRLFSLPATTDCGPLWTPFCRRLFGVVALAPPAEVALAEEIFKLRSRVPVAAVAFDQPQPGAFLLRRGDRAGFRELLAYFVSNFRRPLSVREDA